MENTNSWKIALEIAGKTQETARQDAPSVSEDYSRAYTCARIACYDDFKSAPRITEIQPTTTAEFIENLTTTTYTQAQQLGGSIPYTVIREACENFIHAQFKEIVVSIYDRGNTIRLSDQGPGIEQKDKAQLPGFSSANEPMKKYIRGVGSGFPIIKDYLSMTHGHITIEDNLRSGAVVTISIKPDESRQNLTRAQKTPGALIPPLTDREKDVLFLFTQEQSLRLTDITKELSLNPSTTHRTLSKLEEYGLIETVGKARIITDFGAQVAAQFF